MKITLNQSIMKKNMKMLIMFLSVLLLMSCSENKARLNDDEHPFVVKKIENINNTHSRYYSSSTLGFHNDMSIILPTSLYNIGDTITIQTK